MTYSKRIYLLPVLVFILLTSMVFLIWQESIKRHDNLVQEQFNKIATFAMQEFQIIVKSDVARLENLKKRLEFTEGGYFTHWQRDAEMLLAQNASFVFLEWIDSSMVIKSIYPKEGNEAAIDLNIRNIEYRKDDWIKHSLDSTTNITEWTNLTQGGKAFLVDVPVYYNKRFQGTITAGMDFKDNFDRFTNHLVNFCIELRDEKGTLFYEHNPATKVDVSDKMHYKNVLVNEHFGDQNWSLHVYPTEQLLYTERVTIINFALVVGILLSILVSALILFYLKAKKETQLTLETNQKLSKLNQTLNRERNRAEKASQAKTDFLSNMSHEIRTPLHAILGFINVLKTSDLKEEDKVYMDLMDKSSNNLLSIVNDILMIDKIESGAIEIQEKYFSPSKKILDAVSIFKLPFKEKNLYLETNFTIPYGTYVIGDQNKLLQILTNLIKNALKFTETGGVTISYQEEIIDTYLKVIVEIKDSGIGISASQLKNIFKRFVQIDNSLKKQHEGNGLGLAISKDLAKLLGGTIKVQSSPNEGSVFTLSVMFKIAEQQQQEAVSEQFEYVDLSHLKVLIVDDNKINVIVLKKLLEDMKMSVDVADNGKIAVNQLKTEKYQLVLMDIHMPVMDGYEATKRIRKHDTDIIVFGLSANVTPDAVVKSLESGMNNFITKPFTRERLYQLIFSYFN